MEIIYILLFILTIKVICEYSPPADFCDSLIGKCDAHPYCILKRENGTLQYETDNGYPKKFKYNHYLKDKLVRMFNYFRNIFACGDPPFRNLNNDVIPKAAKMQSVIWNEELEWLSEFLVHKKFLTTRIQCMVTPSFPKCQILDNTDKLAFFHHYSHIWDPLYVPFAGFLVMNISYLHYYRKIFPLIPLDPKSDLNLQIGSIEYNQEDIAQNAHYWAQFLGENVTAIGCTSLHDDFKDGIYTLSTVCLLNDLTMMKPIYSISETPGSECKSKHPEYKCLCNSELPSKSLYNEPMDMNYDELEEEVTCPPKRTSTTVDKTTCGCHN